MKDGSAIGTGIAVYKLLDKYADPVWSMPWKPTLPQLEVSNTLSFVDFFASLLLWAKGGLSTAAREWIIEHGLAAGASGLIGLWMTPAMYVVSGPPYVPGVTAPAMVPPPQYPGRVEVSGAF